MNWDYSLSGTGSKLLPVGSLNCKNLAIEVTIANQPSTWYRAGYLYPLIAVGGGDLPAQPILIVFGAQIIQIPYQPYKLRFDPMDWVKSSYQLKLTKLIMGINFAPSSIENIGSEVVTTIPANIGPVVLDPANPTRRNGFITNKSNRNMWVVFASTPATAAAPTSLVSPGSNIDIPENYTGVINGIWSGPAPTLNAEIHQFNAI
jgi:hypothetical protein